MDTIYSSKQGFGNNTIVKDLNVQLQYFLKFSVKIIVFSPTEKNMGLYGNNVLDRRNNILNKLELKSPILYKSDIFL